MAENKTRETAQDPMEWLARVEPEPRRAEALELASIFGRVTGWKPRMWGPSIVGYGAYEYEYGSGRSGRWMATGFSPRKAHLSLYILPGYTDFGDILHRMGPHKAGQSCVNITRLDRIDLSALEELIAAGLDNLRRQWPVSPS